MHATSMLSATKSFPVSLQSSATLSHLGARHRCLLTYRGYLGLSKAPGSSLPHVKCYGLQVSLVVTLTCRYLSL